MNWVDFVLTIIVLLAVWTGWRNGFILETLGLINWIGSLVLAFIFYPYTASLLTKIFPSLELWKLPLGFIITAIVARILIGLITRQIALATSAYTNQNVLNKTFGIIPGIINGIILAAIISALLLALPLTDGINSAVRNSRIANQLSVKMETVDQKLSPALNKAIYQTLNDLTIHTKSDDS
ncbi:MAG: CvpA family protein [Ginsengibacter sp.]